MIRVFPPIALVFAAGCSPQNASIVAGDYTVFLSATSAITVQKQSVKFEDFDRTFAVDCRDFANTATNATEREQLRVQPRLQVCPGDVGEDGSTIRNNDFAQNERWLRQGGFYGLGEDLEPWRGEAIITSEGDAQITFHQRLPGGGDFRFGFAIDPDFQPQQCVQNEDADGVVLQDIDGDWLDNWSTQLDDGGTLFYLNSSSYQHNPDDLESLWFFPLEWKAGHGGGKFAEDEFTLRSTYYGEPWLYFIDDDPDDDRTEGKDDLYWCELGFDDVAGTSTCSNQSDIGDTDRPSGYNWNDLVSIVEGDADEIQAEYATYGVAWEESTGVPAMRPKVEDNSWRVNDGKAAGLDNWVGMHHNWVKFNSGSEFTKGGSASGEFNMVFEAYDSPSVFFVRGSFTVDRWKNELWASEYLPPVLLEQNGTVLCGE